MTQWVVTEATRLPAWFPTRVDSALDVATQIDQLEDTCQVHEEFEQPLEVTFVRTATELFGSSNGESVCVFSSQRIDRS